MKKYIMYDIYGDLQVIGAAGWIPPEVICEAPEGADYDDGPRITLEQDENDNTIAVLN